MMGNTTDPVNEESMKLVQLESPADGQDMAVMTTDKGVNLCFIRNMRPKRWTTLKSW